MEDEIRKKVLEYPCIKCHQCSFTSDAGYILQNLYCKETKRRINFSEDPFKFCPKLYMAYKELESPHYEKEDLILLKDGNIVLINWFIFNHEENCYEYHTSCADRSRVRHFHDYLVVKHPDTVKKVFIKNDKYVDENGVLV